MQEKTRKNDPQTTGLLQSQYVRVSREDNGELRVKTE